MLDQIDLDLAIGKREYKQRLRPLQERLYDMELALFEARIPALIVFEGWAGAGKIGTISLLTRRLDPRGLRVHPITPARTYEQQYPWLYRFWRKTPSYGRMALFDRSWYREVLEGRARRTLTARGWRGRCEDIAAFEHQLADDGAIVIKFWLHISKQEQGRRFHDLLADRLTAWQVTSEDRWQHKHYGRVRSAVEDLLARTDAPHARWTVLPATSNRYAAVAAFETILAALEARLGRAAPPINAPLADDAAFDDSGPAFRRRLTPTNDDRPMTTDDRRPTTDDGGTFVHRPLPIVEHAIDTARPAEAHLAAVSILHRIDLGLRL